MKEKLFVTSDHHFDHTNIIRYCNRPFSSVKQMNETMIARWNSVVSPNDTVIYLGDFALADKKRIKEIRMRLNGKIFIILGNHDKSVKTMKECGFIVIEDPHIINNIILSHRPLSNDKLNGKINFHGHIHDLMNKDRSHFNISVDVTNYYPIEFEKVLSLPMQCKRCGGPAPRNNPLDLCNKCMAYTYSEKALR